MRIAVVNDSPLAVEALRRVVLREHTIAWTANGGEDAIRKATHDRPDLILMDLVMPGIDGVDATRRIMRESPCPILVVTSTVSGNYTLVYDALGAGAVDAVQTPTLGADGKLAGADALSVKLAQFARKLLGSSATTPASAQTHHAVPLVAIGASTGGPLALTELLGALPSSFPAAVVVVQHIEAEFSLGLMEWLSRKIAIPICAATSGSMPQVGNVFLAVKNDHLTLRDDGRFAYTAVPEDNPFRPNIDVFFESVAHGRPSSPGSAVLLTGMGRDGAEGLLKLRRLGWTTYAQDAESCAVNGMPDAAIKLGAAVHVMSPAAIGRDLAGRVRK